MKRYTYTHPTDISYTGDISVFNEQNEVVAIVRRIYDNPVKRALDRLLDFRYFVKFEVENMLGTKCFDIKRMTRRGKLWFEATDYEFNKKYIVSYENWRVGIPELFISDGTLKMKLEKEMEDWSNYYIDERLIARWKADFSDDKFTMTLEIEEDSPISNVEFFVGVSQMTLFIGA